MGAKKLSYYTNEELGKSPLFLVKALEKRSTADFFGLDYFPYGKILRKFSGGSGDERYLTTGHERDHETISENNSGTGLDNRGARFYDSDVPRMLGVDALAAQAPGWSPYRYAFGNPIMYTDPTGNYETKYEDEVGNLLAETNDGNDATVTISDENKDAFMKEYNKQKSNGMDGSMLFNESWIRRYAIGLSAQGGQNVTNWALDAISPGSSAELSNSENIASSKNGFTINPIGPSLIVLGSRLVPKSGGLGGGGSAGKWTSVASKSLRWVDKSIQSGLGTSAKLPAKGFMARYLGTRGLGAAAGRLVPVVGWGWTAIDVGYQTGKYYGPSKWYGDDDTKWFK